MAGDFQGNIMFGSMADEMNYMDHGDEDYSDNVFVQCGKCYRNYDPLENRDGKCPSCGSDEIVGDR